MTETPAEAEMPPPAAGATTLRLLRWFDATKRDLPWRRTRDAYRIWVSEVMLQQTRVTTVLPYYRRFLRRFPDVEALAKAEIDEVLALWSGLGYYRRARQLHAAARVVVESGGELPDSAAALARLPGIGPYTAAAVASIAFGECEPVLDGNVVRLMARYRAEEGDPRLSATRRRLLEAARELLHPNRPGDSNQALMELGATVCRPRRPLCGECPLQPGCAAVATGAQEAYPRRGRPRETEREKRIAALVLHGDGRVLLFKRPEDSELLAGTWELPSVPWAADRGSEAALSKAYGGRWRLRESRGWVRHGITFRRLEVELREAERLGDEAVAEGPEAAWVEPEGLGDLPVSALVVKLLEQRAV
ncbi:MAG: A/G-specific adenine glycosylase [Thermoanaerobaculia bacterium]|nr:A/G-specific adenine glycosylase [Thermoanaerobaculia bacterium]